MTTDTTSVDALRTRLARAFEVAALRDPGAELAAFETAVRREAIGTVAADVERLTALLADMFRVTRAVDGTPTSLARSDAEEVIEKWQAKGILLDAAAVRHEQGERTLAAVARGIDGYRWYGVRLARDGEPTDVVAVPDLEEILDEARELSPPP